MVSDQYRRINCIDGSSESWEFQTAILGTLVPVEEPSTASEADIGKLFDQLVGGGD